MKILYVITKSNFGGAQRYVFELALAMKTSGHDVSVALGGNGLLKDKLAAEDIRTIEIKNFQRDISLLKEVGAVSEIWRLLKKEKPDVMHLNSSKAVGIGALLGRLAGVRHIVSTVHGWPFLERRPLVWRSFAWLGSWFSVILSHSVIVVSNHDAKLRMPFAQKKLHLIHTALPNIRFKNHDSARSLLFPALVIEKHRNNLWLVTNAELTANKNLFTAIDAVINYNKNAEQKIFYSIMSDGELKNELTSYIAENSAGEYVTLLGYVDDGRTFLKAFDMFLLPSKKEGLPYALLEAGAAGLACIASRVGGIPEVIDHEENGLLIDPNDTHTISNALGVFANDKEKRKTFGATLENKVRDKFALTTMISETVSLYSLRGK